MSEPKYVARCTRCNESFTEEQIANANCCPKCGSKGLPCDPADDLTIRINLHELHILFVWAENFAVSSDNTQLDNPAHESLKETVNIIAERIEKQLPRPFQLTLSREVKEIEKQYPGTTLYRDGREEVP